MVHNTAVAIEHRKNGSELALSAPNHAARERTRPLHSTPQSIEVLEGSQYRENWRGGTDAMARQQRQNVNSERRPFLQNAFQKPTFCQRLGFTKLTARGLNS